MFADPSLDQPAPARRRPPAPKTLPAKAAPWGWLEWFLITQSLIPALLFIPGVSVLRLFTRVAAFMVALVAWLAIWLRGRRYPQDRPFPATPWLFLCVAWLGASLFHPGTNSLASGAAQAAMYLTVLSPVFWVSSTVSSSQQISRIMKITFFFCALNSFVGIGQIYYPTVFNPPYIPAIDDGNDFSISGMTYNAADGRRIIRPCGLSDNPGQASGAGAVACLIGLCMAAQPIKWWKRILCVGVSLAGMVVIYFCQVRAAMVMEFICVFGLIVLFSVRGYYRQAGLLATGTVVLVIAAAVWAVSAVGDVGTKRFWTLIEDKPADLYQSRGAFVVETFDKLIWESPLGCGLGRWGQAYGYFGDRSSGYGGSNGMLWVEVQVPGWVIDGGIPLLVCYAVAIGMAMWSSLQTVLTTRNKELAYWGAVVCTMNLSIVAAAFSACPFVAPSGMGFWVIAVALHAADQRSRSMVVPRRVVPAKQPVGR